MDKPRTCQPPIALLENVTNGLAPYYWGITGGVTSGVVAVIVPKKVELDEFVLLGAGNVKLVSLIFLINPTTVAIKETSAKKPVRACTKALERALRLS